MNAKMPLWSIFTYIQDNDFKTKNGFIEEPFLQALETLPGG